MPEKKKILVVGAGASGLPSIRHCLLYDNVDVVCLEASDDVGGLWRFKPNETEESSVMKTTVINTSKEMTAYSDFPPEAKMANFMHNTEMWRYLKAYADEYNLRKYIKFNHVVNSIKRNTDYEKTGRWLVNYTDDHGNVQDEVYDGILLCSGHHTVPHWPQKFPGQDEFKGRIIHSHSFKDHRGFEDKNVVVVGIGNSGGDVAVELSRIAKQVYLVTRRGSWIFNRIFDWGEPFDVVLNRKFIYDLRTLVPDFIVEWFVQLKLNLRFDHELYGLKPSHRVFGAHPTVNDELPNRIACGTVRIKPNIAKFKECSVIFEDGSSVEDVDEVIMCTGFSFEFNLVEEGKLIPVVENEVDLYKYMFPAATADHNTLAVIGLVQPFGSIMPLSEIQARVFLENIAGSHRLPSKKEMVDDIESKKSAMARRYVKSRRHTIQVDYVPFIDELANSIGCGIEWKHLIKTDPALAFKLYFGPMVPYIYRLNGPKSWPKARATIMTVPERVREATNTKPKIREDYWLVYLAVTVVAFLFFFIYKL